MLPSTPSSNGNLLPRHSLISPPPHPFAATAAFRAKGRRALLCCPLLTPKLQIQQCKTNLTELSRTEVNWAMALFNRPPTTAEPGLSPSCQQSLLLPLMQHCAYTSWAHISKLTLQIPFRHSFLALRAHCLSALSQWRLRHQPRHMCKPTGRCGPCQHAAYSSTAPAAMLLDVARCCSMLLDVVSITSDQYTSTPVVQRLTSPQRSTLARLPSPPVGLAPMKL
jgi:hypothetical protein